MEPKQNLYSNGDEWDKRDEVKFKIQSVEEKPEMGLPSLFSCVVFPSPLSPSSLLKQF
jgi:hypothetical protein